MLSIYKLDKRQRELNESKKREKLDQKLQAKSRENREILIENYNSRIQKFINDMNEQPIHVKSFQNIPHTFRETKNDKFLGAKVISPNRWLCEKQRIEQTLEQNKIFFSEATDDKKKGLKLRVREADKEIQPEMKYTGKSMQEKIADALMHSLIFKMEEIEKKEGVKIKFRRQSLLGEQSKQELPLIKQDKSLKMKQKVINKLEDNSFANQNEMKNQQLEQDKKRFLKKLQKGQLSSKGFKTSQELFLKSPKELRPDLHQKTHFKAVMAFQLQQQQAQLRQGIRRGGGTEQIKSAQNFNFEQRLGSQQQLQDNYNIQQQRSLNPILANPINQKKLKELQQLNDYQVTKNNEGGGTRNRFLVGPITQQTKSVNFRLNDTNESILNDLKSINQKKGFGARIDEEKQLITKPTNFASLLGNDDEEQQKYQTSNQDNTYDVSQSILVSCNIFSQKQKAFLKKGEGHLQSNIASNNKDFQNSLKLSTSFTRFEPPPHASSRY